jgi:hypothetical protein
MRDGVAYDFHDDDAKPLSGDDRLQWFRDRIGRAMIGSNAILAASVSEIPYYTGPGLYFLIWQDRICYVGQAGVVGQRIVDHFREGRPISRAAVILGLPKWSLDEFEQAYVAAWDLPWNDERRRRGQLSDLPELMAAAEALDRSAVMPWYAPKLAREERLKRWQLHVIGYQQARFPPASITL